MSEIPDKALAPYCLEPGPHTQWCYVCDAKHDASRYSVRCCRCAERGYYTAWKDWRPAPEPDVDPVTEALAKALHRAFSDPGRQSLRAGYPTSSLLIWYARRAIEAYERARAA